MIMTISISIITVHILLGALLFKWLLPYEIREIMTFKNYFSFFKSEVVGAILLFLFGPFVWLAYIITYIQYGNSIDKIRNKILKLDRR